MDKDLAKEEFGRKREVDKQRKENRRRNKNQKYSKTIRVRKNNSSGFDELNELSLEEDNNSSAVMSWGWHSQLPEEKACSPLPPAKRRWPLKLICVSRGNDGEMVRRSQSRRANEVGPSWSRERNTRLLDVLPKLSSSSSSTPDVKLPLSETADWRPLPPPRDTARSAHAVVHNLSKVDLTAPKARNFEKETAELRKQRLREQMNNSTCVVGKQTGTLNILTSLSPERVEQILSQGEKNLAYQLAAEKVRVWREYNRSCQCNNESICASREEADKRIWLPLRESVLRRLEMINFEEKYLRSSSMSSMIKERHSPRANTSIHSSKKWRREAEIEANYWTSEDRGDLEESEKHGNEKCLIASSEWDSSGHESENMSSDCEETARPGDIARQHLMASNSILAVRAVNKRNMDRLAQKLKNTRKSNKASQIVAKDHDADSMGETSLLRDTNDELTDALVVEFHQDNNQGTTRKLAHHNGFVPSRVKTSLMLNPAYPLQELLNRYDGSENVTEDDSISICQSDEKTSKLSFSSHTVSQMSQRLVSVAADHTTLEYGKKCFMCCYGKS